MHKQQARHCVLRDACLTSLHHHGNNLLQSGRWCALLIMKGVQHCDVANVWHALRDCSALLNALCGVNMVLSYQMVLSSQAMHHQMNSAALLLVAVW